MGCLCSGTGSGGLQGGLCEDRLELPCVRHSQFQTASTDPPQLTQAAKTVVPLRKHIEDGRESTIIEMGKEGLFF